MLPETTTQDCIPVNLKRYLKKEKEPGAGGYWEGRDQENLGSKPASGK
jgi:hypothetical protein